MHPVTPAALPDTAPSPPRRRWRRRLILVVLLLAGAGGGLLLLSSDDSDREYREAAAETDRIDPGWRFEELDARRKPVADEDNAALVVLTARGLLPAQWQMNVDERLGGLPSEVRLDDALARDLAADLAAFEPALVEARKLKRLSWGRFPVTWSADVIGTKLDCVEARPVAYLLEYEATAQAEAGRPGEALATGRGVLVAARSIGDEPLVMSLLIRQAIRAVAVRSLERTLAQGTPPEAELQAVQALFEDEAAQPLLLNVLRGERAATQRTIEAARQALPGLGTALRSGDTNALRQRLDFRKQRRMRRWQTDALRRETACVEAAKLPLEEHGRAFAPLQPALPLDDDDIVGSLTMASVKIAESYRRSQAVLRVVVVALALERYRLAEQHWPDQLRELTPAYLPDVPLDPYDGRELRYKKLSDGVLVYSIGPDEQDNGGALNRKNVTAAGSDLGFRLWDVTARRQPAAELLPPPDELRP
jgi:hypothetical protein